LRLGALGFGGPIALGCAAVSSARPSAVPVTCDAAAPHFVARHWHAAEEQCERRQHARAQTSRARDPAR
jgi:hypothetical protein